MCGFRRVTGETATEWQSAASTMLFPVDQQNDKMVRQLDRQERMPKSRSVTEAERSEEVLVTAPGAYGTLAAALRLGFSNILEKTGMHNVGDKNIHVGADFGPGRATLPSADHRGLPVYESDEHVD